LPQFEEHKGNIYFNQNKNDIFPDQSYVSIYNLYLSFPTRGNY
jgi:hypothetical protein